MTNGGESRTSWPVLVRAGEAADRRREQLGDLLRDVPSDDDASIVVFGSLARRETTVESDVDWTLLIDGQVSARHFEAAREIELRLESAELKEPRPQGTFGGLAFSHDILHRIGGEEDSNRNLTQRILLLLESAPVGPAAAYDRVQAAVLNRYVAEDAGLGSRTEPVPRFLLNDVARYWRTVAVDFAYKRRERASKGWAIRTVKLRLSRKLTYASGLLACFSCASEPSIRDAEDRTQAVIDHLASLLRIPALDRVAVILRDRGLDDAVHALHASYADFLALLNDAEARNLLEMLAPEDAHGDAMYQRAREIGRSFQDALDRIFFKESVELAELTRTYGVF